MRIRRRKIRAGESGIWTEARGAAVIEFALVAPLLFAVVFGIFEFGWRLMVKQTMVQATQVAARTASLPGSTDTEILAAVQGHMEAAGYSFSGGEVTVKVTHATPDDPTEWVTVSIPREKVSITKFFGTPTGMMSVTAVVPKEGGGQLDYWN